MNGYAPHLYPGLLERNHLMITISPGKPEDHPAPWLPRPKHTEAIIQCRAERSSLSASADDYQVFAVPLCILTACYSVHNSYCYCYCTWVSCVQWGILVDNFVTKFRLNKRSSRRMGKPPTPTAIPIAFT